MCPAKSQPDSAAQTVLATLRKPRNEAQFTQFIAAVADASTSFAPRLAGLLVASASRPDAAALMRDPPADTRCRAERTVWSLEGVGLGRVDLVFEDRDQTYYLLVEHKLGSDYGNRQLERYRDALSTVPANRRGLLAITTMTPLHGEETVGGDPRWMGSIRWWRIYPELCDLPHADPLVGAIWRETLALMRKQGDFGPMDADAEAIRGWAQRDAAEEMMRYLLHEVTEPTCQLLDAALGSAGATRVVRRGKHGTASVVHPIRNRPHVKFIVPEEAEEERLWVQFHAGDGEPFFSVEARYQHPKESLADDERVGQATKFLRERGFRCDNDGWGHYWAWIVPVEDVIGGPETRDNMIEEIRRATSDLAESQMFAALAARVPATAITEPQPEETEEGEEIDEATG